ncbi:MAG: hypothetical protein AB3X44_08025 [Leptothrix sp. (in: b-proteobacteria)]
MNRNELEVTVIPLDLPALMQALAWPMAALIALGLLHEPIGELVVLLAKRAKKVSIGGVSLELSEVAPVKAAALVDTEIRALKPGAMVGSGSTAIAQLLKSIQGGQRRDYLRIDLGSQDKPRWLTSRLYLVAYLMCMASPAPNFLFIENTPGASKKFVGFCSAASLRWALARKYPWFENAMAQAYSGLGQIQFDAASGYLLDWQFSSLIPNFLSKIQSPVGPASPDAAEWTLVRDGMHEHAKWVDSLSVDQALGDGLNRALVVRTFETKPADLVSAVLLQKGPYVAVVDANKSFTSLVDRTELLEKAARVYATQQE